ncbi:MAG: hypothetical protein JW753_07135 [Dehalococcoidia bacterium]|nr:hypothetical protein [Dehalococcoidia bacterium]
MSGGKIALLVFGIIFLVGALVLMAGGGGLMWLSRSLENDNSLFASRTTHLQEDSYAIISEPFDIDWYDESEGTRWGFDFVKVKVEVENKDSSKGTFVGIARETDVDDYLSGVRYHEITDWASDRFDDPEVDYRPHSGDLTPSGPTTEAFWEVSAHGSGRQTIEWQPEMGRWVLVVMNEDGSAGIDVSGTLGAELPWLYWLGLGLFLVGFLTLVGGAVMVYFAARSPKQTVMPARTTA